MNIEQLKNLRSGTKLYYNNLHTVPDPVWMINNGYKLLDHEQARKKFEKITLVIQTTRSSYSLNGQKYVKTEKCYLQEHNGELYNVCCHAENVVFEHEIDGLIDAFIKEQKKILNKSITKKQAELAKLKKHLSDMK